MSFFVHPRPTGASLSYFHARVQRHLNKWVFGGITHAALLNAVPHADSAPARTAVFIGEQATPSTCPAHFIIRALLIDCSCHLHVFHHLHSHTRHAGTWTLSQMWGLSGPYQRLSPRRAPAVCAQCSVQRQMQMNRSLKPDSDASRSCCCNLQDDE